MKGGEVTPPPPVIPKAIRNLGRVRPQKNEERKKRTKQREKDEKIEKTTDEQEEAEKQSEQEDPTGRGKVVDVIA